MNDTFDSPLKGALSVFILLTSENYPAVVSPSYAYSGWALLYFMPGVLILCSFVGGGLVLGQVYDSFTTRMNRAVRDQYSRELRGYAFAFLMITEHQRLHPSEAPRRSSVTQGAAAAEAAAPANDLSATLLPADIEARDRNMSVISNQSLPAVNENFEALSPLSQQDAAVRGRAGTNLSEPTFSPRQRTNTLHSNPTPTSHTTSLLKRAALAHVSKIQGGMSPRARAAFKHQQNLLSNNARMTSDQSAFAMVRTASRMQEIRQRSGSIIHNRQMDTRHGSMGDRMNMLQRAASVAIDPDAATLDFDALGEVSEEPVQPAVAITVIDWRRLVAEFNSNSGTQHNQKFADITFKFRDSDHSEDIDLSEFLSLAKLLKYELVGIEQIGKEDGWLFKQCVDTHWFASATSVCILLSVALPLGFFEGILHQSESSDALHGVLLALYLSLIIEAIIRWSARGFEAASAIWCNVIDVMIAVGIAVALVDRCIAQSDNCEILKHHGFRWFGLLVLRVLNLGRCSIWETEFSLLWWTQHLMARCSFGLIQEDWGSKFMRKFNLQLMNTVTRTAQLFVHAGGVLFCVLYVLAVCGSLFGDVIQIENAKQTKEQYSAATQCWLDQSCAGPPVDESMTNFSTIGHSLVAMFQVLAENNWNDLVYTVGAGCGPWSKAFMVLSYVILVLIMLNVFASIVLQSFEVHIEGAESLGTSADDSAESHGVLLIESHDGCCYKLQRSYNHRAHELHLALMDESETDLLTEFHDNSGDNMFTKALISSEKEIVKGTARLPKRTMALMLLCSTVLSILVVLVSLNSCTCKWSSSNCSHVA